MNNISEKLTEMALKNIVKIMWTNTIQNCLAIGCCTILAVVFHKWWLIFIAIIFWRNINPVKMFTDTNGGKSNE